MPSIDKDFNADPKDVLNPWLTDLVKEYLQKHRAQELDEEYAKLCERRGHPSWTDFIARKALQEKIRERPELMTSLVSSALPDDVRRLFRRNNIETIQDLMQVTREELISLYDEPNPNLSPIEAFLEAYGLHLYSSPDSTYKLSVEDPLGEEADGTITVIQAREMALDIMRERKDTFKERLEKVMDICAEADKLAQTSGCDEKEHEELLFDYILYLKCYLDFYGPRKEAVVVARRAMEKTGELYGTEHPRYGVALYRTGSINMSLYDWETARELLTQSAAIIETAPEGASARKDLDEVYELLGTCCFELMQYEQALKAFEKAYNGTLGKTPPDMDTITRLNNKMADTYKAMGDMVSYSVLKWTKPGEKKDTD